jgi:hypothetical protein
MLQRNCSKVQKIRKKYSISRISFAGQISLIFLGTIDFCIAEYLVLRQNIA